jgi:hypothetical protein
MGMRRLIASWREGRVHLAARLLHNHGDWMA